MTVPPVSLAAVTVARRSLWVQALISAPWAKGSSEEATVYSSAPAGRYSPPLISLESSAAAL